MKIRLHTKTKPMLIILTDGSTYSTFLKRSVSSRDKQWALSLDTQSHPFWQRKGDWDQNILDMSSQRARFQKKYDLPGSNALKSSNSKTH